MPSFPKFIRGCFSTEVCFYLVACKLNYPHTFHMLRGNHECRQLSEHFNFKAECTGSLLLFPSHHPHPHYHQQQQHRTNENTSGKSKYDESVYTEFMEMFDALPLAALIRTKRGKYLAVHGGLSPFVKNIQEIKAINRFEEPVRRLPFIISYDVFLQLVSCTRIRLYLAPSCSPHSFKRLSLKKERSGMCFVIGSFLGSSLLN